MSERRADTPARRSALTWLFGLTLGASSLVGAGCGSAPAGEIDGAQAQDFALSGELLVDPTLSHQNITGFGASSAWTARSLSDTAADLLFSPDVGIGLSLLRLRIAPDGSSEVATAESAHRRGAAVWAAPWSPPGAWKTSGTDNNGGALLPEYYQTWADRLSGFAAMMADRGVPLLALSAQNEPNWVADWETCEYTPSELKTFIRDYLGPALRRDSPGTVLLAPESINWMTLQTYTDPLLADPAANREIGIVAVHSYGGTPFDYESPAAHGKELWETEVSYENHTGLAAALDTARQIHGHLTVANVNAFHYWWLVSDAGAALMVAATGELTPQAYGLGHYSKFVRPGFVRIDMPATPESGIFSSAYADRPSGRVVIVAGNETSSPSTATFRIKGMGQAHVEPWLTTADETLAEQSAIDFQSAFQYTLPAQSITTLVVSPLDPPSPEGNGGEGGQPASAGGAAGEPALPSDAGNDGVAGDTAGQAGNSDDGGQTGEPPPGGRSGSGGTGHGGSGGRAVGAGGSSQAAGRAAYVEAPARAPRMACSASDGRVASSGAASLLAALAVFASRRRSVRGPR